MAGLRCTTPFAAAYNGMNARLWPDMFRWLSFDFDHAATIAASSDIGVENNAPGVREASRGSMGIL